MNSERGKAHIVDRHTSKRLNQHENALFRILILTIRRNWSAKIFREHVSCPRKHKILPECNENQKLWGTGLRSLEAHFFKTGVFGQKLFSMASPQPT